MRAPDSIIFRQYIWFKVVAFLRLPPITVLKAIVDASKTNTFVFLLKFNHFDQNKP